MTSIPVPPLTTTLSFGDDIFSQAGITPVRIFASAGSDYVAVRALSWAGGSAGNDTLVGVSYDAATGLGVRLSGEAGNDSIYGSRGDDILQGGADNDLVGGSGSYTIGGDEMWGGSGADRFYQSTGTKNAVSGLSSGWARDFSIAEGDKIALGGATGYTLTDGIFKDVTGAWVSATNDSNVNIFVQGVTANDLVAGNALNGSVPVTITSIV